MYLIKGMCTKSFGYLLLLNTFFKAKQKLLKTAENFLPSKPKEVGTDTSFKINLSRAMYIHSDTKMATFSGVPDCEMH